MKNALKKLPSPKNDLLCFLLPPSYNWKKDTDMPGVYRTWQIPVACLQNSAKPPGICRKQQIFNGLWDLTETIGVSAHSWVIGTRWRSGNKVIKKNFGWKKANSGLHGQ